MENYLVEQYDVFEDKKYLLNESEIKEYFKDNGRDFLDCGQGYYEDNAEVLCKVGDKFYAVSIKALVLGEKRDIGDKFYFVDEITEVTYKEIEKPKPKTERKVQYTLVLTDYQKTVLESFMKGEYIKFECSEDPSDSL